MSAIKTRAEAWSLLCDYTQSESLLKHALSVEAALLFYADKLGGDRELWGNTGLLHDFDYEKFPNYSLEGPSPSGHPFEGCKILTDLGYPKEMTDAILGHATYSGVARLTDLAKALLLVMNSVV